MLGRDAGPGSSSAPPFEDMTSNGHARASQLRREIVVTLRRDGPASPDQLARRVGASRTGVLQQLKALESGGLVNRQTVRHGVGRPRHVYDVTGRAQDLFPSNYDGLANSLLSAIEELGGRSLVDQAFDARRRQLGAAIRQRMADRVPAGSGLIERVRELATIQDEQGYLCGSVFRIEDGAIRLSEHNCAIYHVAAERPAACAAELALFREVLGADVVRETHIVSGDRSCTYRISERPS
jgi:predicted ArsR family transcriptional regulator